MRFVLVLWDLDWSISVKCYKYRRCAEKFAEKCAKSGEFAEIRFTAHSNDPRKIVEKKVWKNELVRGYF